LQGRDTWADFLPAVAPFVVFLGGLWLIQQVNAIGIPIPPPDFKAGDIAGREGLARYWVALSLLILVVVGIGASVFAAVTAWEAATDRPRRWRFAATVIGLIILSVVVVKVLAPGYFYEYLGSGLFAGTLKKYPGTPNALTTLELFIDIGNAVGLLAAASLAAAVCVLVPDKARAIGANAVKDQRAIDAATVEIAKHIRLLKHLLGAATLVLLAALVHMKAWREWPLAFWMNPKDASAVAFGNLVSATITYQAGHFVCILAAIFLPVAFRLKGEGIRLSVLEHGERVSGAHETWLSNKGLSLSTSEIVQRAIAIVAPFLVPAAAEAVALLKPVLEKMAQ
jgi:hypothetical protein